MGGNGDFAIFNLKRRRALGGLHQCFGTGETFQEQQGPK